MDQATPSAPTPPLTEFGAEWFDPLEDAVRGEVRAFIERLLEEELEAALGRGRYARDRAARGHRNGHRERRLDTTFGPLVLTVPRARLAADEAGEREWKSALLPAYRRLSRRAELLIAEVYLAGVNTRRVRRALQTLFAGRIGKDAVSRAWRRTRAAWKIWQQRDLADDDIVRLILDGTDGGKGLEAALASLWDDVPVQRCSVHKERNLLAHAPQHLHDEIKADFNDLMYAPTAGEVLARRKAFLAKWRLRCRPVATSLEEAGERLFTFVRYPPEQWRSARTTNAVERLHEEFKRRIKTQCLLPCAETAAMLFWALLASGQITMRRVDGWTTLERSPTDLDLAA